MTSETENKKESEVVVSITVVSVNSVFSSRESICKGILQACEKMICCLMDTDENVVECNSSWNAIHDQRYD